MIQNVGLSDPGTWFDGLLELFEDLNKTSRQSHTKVCTEFVHLPSRLPGRLDLNSAQLRYSCHDSLQQGWASAESWSFPHRHGILARRFKDSHCLDFWALASNGWNLNHIEFFFKVSTSRCIAWFGEALDVEICHLWFASYLSRICAWFGSKVTYEWPLKYKTQIATFPHKAFAWSPAHICFSGQATSEWFLKWGSGYIRISLVHFGTGFDCYQMLSSHSKALQGR